MRTKEFLGRLDHERISAAIKTAESRSSGEIRVFVRRGEVEGDPLAAAQKEFTRIGMEKTAQRNAILIYVAPRARKLAVVGDEGVHRKSGAEFWEKLVATMRDQFQREAFTEALVDAIASAGELLAQHFPRGKDDRNELSNDVIEGD